MAITIDDFSKIWASTSPLTPYEFSENNYKDGWNFIGGTPPSRQMWDFLQKNNDEKMQYLANNYLPLSGGTMTGEIIRQGFFLKSGSDTGEISIGGGNGYSNGGLAILYGKSHASFPGRFALRAYDGVNSSYLTGDPNGALIWRGKNVLTDDTVGTVVSQSFTSETTLSANTPTNLGSISLSAGTWVVTGHIRYKQIIAGRQFIAINDSLSIEAGTESCNVHCSDIAVSSTLALSTTRIFTLTETKTIYLIGYAGASCVAGADNHLTAVRII